MASYVTGKEGGGSDSDDNLQWLKHGPYDENQTLVLIMGCRGHFRVESRSQTGAEQ